MTKRYQVRAYGPRDIAKIERKWHRRRAVEYFDGYPTPDGAADDLADIILETPGTVLCEVDAIDDLPYFRSRVAEHNTHFARIARNPGDTPPTLWAVVDTMPTIEELGAGYYPSRWEWERTRPAPRGAMVPSPLGVPTPRDLGATIRYALKQYGAEDIRRVLGGA